jgi:GT2 family glycosyltransferase
MHTTAIQTGQNNSAHAPRGCTDAAATNGFSIVIPTYNRADLLRAALKSVFELSIPTGYIAEILVIDNNSTDHTATVVAEAARESPILLRYVRETMQGASHVRNRGVIEARFEHIVFLDDDMTEVAPRWLEAYAASLSSLTPDCVVGPVVPHYALPTEDWMTPDILKCTAEYSRKGDTAILIPADQAHEIPGCNFAIRKSIAIEVGGFNTELGPVRSVPIRGEDFELGERLVLLGKRVVYLPDCRICHFISPEKMSLKGVRKRWEGDGLTRRRMMSVRGSRLSAQDSVRMTARILRYLFRSAACGIAGKSKAALKWELEARQLCGIVFAPHRNITPRTLPLQPLQSAHYTTDNSSPSAN